MIFETVEYKMIQAFYGDRRAKRSQVPLMNHIDEGLLVLDAIQAHGIAKQAWCLHPIVQDPCHDQLMCISLGENGLSRSSGPLVSMPGYGLARQYAQVANAYLCKAQTDDVTMEYDPHKGNVKLYDLLMREGIVPHDVSTVVWQMLYADKLQNQKDFRKYHFATHERAVQLDLYFIRWINYLRKLVWQ